MARGTRLRNIRVPDDLWAAMLAATRERGENVTAATLRFYREYVEEER